MKKIITFLAALLAGLLCFASDSAKFNVATYNIRLYHSGDSLRGNGWQRRGPMVAKLAYFHDFDIFGTQEGYKRQLNDILAEMPGYAYIGVGRDDGKDGGETSAIFYNTELFDLLDHGDFWLAEDTTRPNLGWDAACVRICTWGKFRHKPSGREFLYFNLHMDHIGKVARIESAKLIKEKMKEFGTELPAILSGDFNVDQTSDAYASIIADGKLKDAFTEAEFVYAPVGTFNNWHTDAFSKQRIDHIFLSPEFKVLKYGVLTDTYRTTDGNYEAITAVDAPEVVKIDKVEARTPSDHFPVKITVVLP